MNLSGLSEKTDGARGTCRATTTEQNGKTSLLPLPVSPSNIHTLLQASKCNLTKVVVSTYYASGFLTIKYSNF